MAQVVSCQSLTGGLGSPRPVCMRLVVDRVLVLGYALPAGALVVHRHYRSTNAVRTFMKFFTTAV